MALTTTALSPNNLVIPYIIARSLPKQTINPLGYAVQQQRGLVPVQSTLNLNYTNLTEEEFQAFITLFKIKNPFQIFSISLLGGVVYKLAKPNSFNPTKYYAYVDGTRVLRYNLAFSSRILS